MTQNSYNSQFSSNL